MFRKIVNRIAAWRRGDTSTGTSATRGRIYTKKSGHESGPPNVIKSPVRPIGVLTPSRVYSAKDGRWFTINEWEQRK